MQRIGPGRRIAVSIIASVGAVLVIAVLGARLRSADPIRTVDITIDGDERWWVGVVSESHRLPLGRDSAPFEIDLFGNTAGNQVQPLLLSTKGRYLWSEDPFRLSVRNGSIHVASDLGPLVSGRAGGSLREAALHAGTRFFPPSGKTPDAALFTKPQFNTWIELTYNQNQRDVLAYAHAIVGNGFPPGVLMIDEGWFDSYGVWDFHRGRFPDPKAMVDELHALGFKLMLWVCPYIRPDGQQFAAMLRDRSRVVWLRSAKDPNQPALMQWWNGFSAVADVTSPAGRDWLTRQLQRLTEVYGIDGFKLDGADAELFAQIGLAFPLNEYRATWKMGGQPLAQRLRDKEHTWQDLRKLVPGMINLGLMGYPFSCPDMIGGGEFLSFENLPAVDQELVVRAAQVHALMPMMQFSVAPWRVLTPEHLAIVRRMATLHADHGADIVALAHDSARTGEPILRSLEYSYPNQGFGTVVDEFLLGPDILVAPVVEQGARQRRLLVPPGRWKGDDGVVVTGPSSIEVAAPLDRLPWYRRVQ